MSDVISSENWTASHDHMPGKERTLRVEGTVVYPTPGYRVWLEPSEPQGINERVLEMNLREQRPDGPVTDIVTPHPVLYEDQTDVEYDHVHIREVGELIEVTHPE